MQTTLLALLVLVEQMRPIANHTFPPPTFPATPSICIFVVHRRAGEQSHHFAGSMSLRQRFPVYAVTTPDMHFTKLLVFIVHPITYISSETL